MITEDCSSDNKREASSYIIRNIYQESDERIFEVYIIYYGYNYAQYNRCTSWSVMQTIVHRVFLLIKQLIKNTYLFISILQLYYKENPTLEISGKFAKFLSASVLKKICERLILEHLFLFLITGQQETLELRAMSFVNWNVIFILHKTVTFEQLEEKI